MALHSTSCESMLAAGRSTARADHFANKLVVTRFPAFKPSVGPLIQQLSVSKLHITRSHTLRLGAAEEGISSWEEKLDSTSSAKGDILDGADSETVSIQTSTTKSADDDNRQDLAVDEEGNIDNIEQEQTNYAGRRPYEVLEERDQQSQNGSDDMMSMTDHAASSFALEDRSHERGVREGDKGMVVVENPQVLPLGEKDLSATHLEERDKLGWSEASCDEGSLLKRITEDEQKDRGEGLQEDKLKQLEEEVFEGDGGRTPEDYHRRADLFGRSADQFVAQKQRNESHAKKFRKQVMDCF